MAELRHIKKGAIATWKEFCLEEYPFGLEYDPGAVEALIEEQRSAQVVAQAAEPLPKHGEIGNGRSRGYDITSTPDRGTSADYLASRIARDRPDIRIGLPRPIRRNPTLHKKDFSKP